MVRLPLTPAEVARGQRLGALLRRARGRTFNSIPGQGQRDAILLRYGPGFTAAEAAEVMGNQKSTVRSRLRTGRRRLTTLLRLRCPEHPDGKNLS
ncbi:sigma factor-like helix-turn-helix DNA-binding protein [Streptomyces sp. NPDC059787]|uniref:sigma factor-like helix-turn-helix DNA-binding protein n=1 Tax=Streptomyces sp. NPDC059787 TaxID=3346947 RepID=UPI00365D88B2